VPEAMYWRIAQDLRQEIESGKLAPGAQLATELELRERYHASRNTVRDAVKWLVNRGLVETRPGQGTFVVEKIEPFVTTLSADPETGLGGGEGIAALAEVTAQGRKAEASTPLVEIQKAGAPLAALLQIQEGTQVVSRHQKRYIDGTPWSMQTSYYPMELVLKGAQKLIEATDIPEGTVRYLADTLGVRQVGCRDRIMVRPPNEGEVTFFRLPDNGRVAVVVISRTGYAADGTPFRTTFSVFPVDRNQFVINVGEVPDRPAVPT
jgi:GntR family transcriptional regulator